uniref:Protein Jade-1 n=1 Tax=Neogobius melanostomus TaxID=47308 RepID=A0A8C6TMK0_9GOBI
ELRGRPISPTSHYSENHPLSRGAVRVRVRVFRTDLITAMKVPDSYQLNPEDFYFLADPWRQEWEKGVQVPVSPHSIPSPVLSDKGKEVMFARPKKLIRTSGSEALGYVDIRTLAEGTCRYDLDEEDVAWLHVANEEFTEMAVPRVDEASMERVLEELERRCHENMAVAVETQEGLGIEFDEDVVCDVCQSPDGEDANEMVFCDKCNICVHQACYGIQKVPTGSWLCRICALGILPKCQLCPKKGGAMKPTRSGTKWVHVSCALWIPEVSIGNPEKMEPVTNVSQIPSNRWALICCICKEKTGACIQCSAKNCRSAFHVTCCQKADLEMSTTLTEEEEVKFKAFCPKHSGLDESEENPDCTGDQQQNDKAANNNKRPSKRDEDMAAELQEMEDEFYKFVDVEEVAARLKLTRDTVDFLFQYWKLKRKANFNRPLARREQEVLRRRLQLFTHLRQDLERVGPDTIEML